MASGMAKKNGAKQYQTTAVIHPILASRARDAGYKLKSVTNAGLLLFLSQTAERQQELTSEYSAYCEQHPAR